MSSRADSSRSRKSNFRRRRPVSPKTGPSPWSRRGGVNGGGRGYRESGAGRAVEGEWWREGVQGERWKETGARGRVRERQTLALSQSDTQTQAHGQPPFALSEADTRNQAHSQPPSLYRPLTQSPSTGLQVTRNPESQQGVTWCACLVNSRPPLGDHAVILAMHHSHRPWHSSHEVRLVSSQDGGAWSMTRSIRNSSQSHMVYATGLSRAQNVLSGPNLVDITTPFEPWEINSLHCSVPESALALAPRLPITRCPLMSHTH